MSETFILVIIFNLNLLSDHDHLQPSNAWLQLRRALSIQAEGKGLTWEGRYRAVSCKPLLDFASG